MDNAKLTSLFEGTANLTEEFKTSAKTLIEQTISEQVQAQKAELEKTLQEQYEAKLEEKYNEIVADHEAELQENKQQYQTQLEEKYNQIVADHEAEIAAINEQVDGMAEQRVKELCEEIANTVDEYTSYAVNEFVKENEQQLEAHYENEIASDFFNELCELMKKYNVKCPEKSAEQDEAEVKEAQNNFEQREAEMQKEIDEAWETIGELHREKTQLQEQVFEQLRQSILREAAVNNGLTAVEASKVEKLIEGFVGDEKAFAEKADQIAKAVVSEGDKEKDDECECPVSEAVPADKCEDKDCKQPKDFEVEAIVNSLKALNRK